MVCGVGGRTDSEIGLERRGNAKEQREAEDRNRDGRWEEEAMCVVVCVNKSAGVQVVKVHLTRCGGKRVKVRNLSKA